MSISVWQQADFNSIFAILTRLADAFAPHAVEPPNMTLVLDPGHVFDGATLTEIGTYTTGTTSSGSTTISNLGTVAGIQAGMLVLSPGIPAGATVSSIGTNQITLSIAATASVAPAALSIVQVTGTFSAPITNPRIDRIVVDRMTGVLSVVTGTEATSPNPPAIPTGKAPVAQVLLRTSSTAITNDMITDERDLSRLGAADVFTEPRGRLTLLSGTPVMTVDATAQQTVYYAPYKGNQIPLYNGASFNTIAFAQLSLALDSNSGHAGYQASGSLYDLFVFSNSGTIALGTGPAWSSSTSRGSGAGTTELQQLNGLWTNKNQIVLRYGNASGNTTTIPAGQATYVGTMYATANGQTAFSMRPAAAAGGADSILGLWNGYNRVPVKALSMDSTANWNYQGGVRPANNSLSNRISWVDGLQQSSIRADYAVTSYGPSAPNNVATYVGVGLDSSSAFSGAQIASFTNTQAIGGASLGFDEEYPQLGFHFVQALEQTGANTVTFQGNGNQILMLELDM